MSQPIRPLNLPGLSDQEVRERPAQEGYNEQPTAKKRTFFHLRWEVVREPMFLMLIMFRGIDLMTSVFMNYPPALQEMVFAVWLIVKGVNSPVAAASLQK